MAIAVKHALKDSGGILLGGGGEATDGEPETVGDNDVLGQLVVFTAGALATGNCLGNGSELFVAVNLVGTGGCAAATGNGSGLAGGNEVVAVERTIDAGAAEGDFILGLGGGVASAPTVPCVAAANNSGVFAEAGFRKEGVFINGLAGDEAYKVKGNGFSATDLVSHIGNVIKNGTC